MEKPVLIDLSKYRKSGEGANGSSYDSLEDPNVMVKIYNKEYPKDPIIEELTVARNVYSLGVKSPEPGILVTDGERIGIKFRRIVGKRSYSRMLADEPERYDEFAREFARECRQLHSIECPKGMFPDAKQQFRTFLEADTVLDEQEWKNLSDFLDSVPECSTALHGDMHIGNLISTLPAGAPLSTPHDVYFIDLGYFSYGYPLLDIGMMYNICLTADEGFRQHDYHVTGEMTAKVWESFADEYFKGTVRPSDQELRKYAALKLMLVEFNIGHMPDNYVGFFKETFKQ